MTAGAAPEVAVIGVGRWGEKHLAKLAELRGGSRVGFYEEDAGRRAEVAARYPAVASFGSWQEFLASGCRAAVIAAPAARHAALARHALAAGKDLLVEKPLALAAAEAAELVTLAARGGNVLMVGHILLFDPAFEALGEAVRRGELGAVKYLVAERAKLGTIRVEEDVLFSLAAHDVAAALWLLGATPRAVSAVATRASGAGGADAAFVDLSFAGGVNAHIWASWLYPVPTRRFVVVGGEAMAALDQLGAGELTIYECGARPGPGGPAVFDRGRRRVAVAPVDSLAAELKHFLSCVATRERPRADGRQGLAVVKALAAAQKSAAGGGAPVRLEGES